MIELITPDGQTKPFEYAGDKPTLEELQAIVGGYIQYLPCNDGRMMYINEEGKLQGLEPNEAASRLVTLFPGDAVVGPALVGQTEDFE